MVGWDWDAPVPKKMKLGAFSREDQEKWLDEIKRQLAKPPRRRRPLPKGILDLEGAAAVLGVSVSTADRMAKDRKFPQGVCWVVPTKYAKKHATYRFDRDRLIAWRNRQQ